MELVMLSTLIWSWLCCQHWFGFELQKTNFNIKAYYYDHDYLS